MQVSRQYSAVSPFFNTTLEFFLHSDKVRTFTWPNNSRRTPPGDDSFHSHYRRTSFHRPHDFIMESTSEGKPQPHLGSPTNGDINIGKSNQPVREETATWVSFWEVRQVRQSSPEESTRTRGRLNGVNRAMGCSSRRIFQDFPFFRN